MAIHVLVVSYQLDDDSNSLHMKWLENHHFHLKNCLAFRCQIASSKWAANTNPLSSYDLDESGETTVILKPEFRAQRNTFH